MQVFRRLIAAAMVWALASPAFAASTIDTTQPRTNGPLLSINTRNNFIAAANDINNILGKFGANSAPASPSVLQDWVNESSTPWVWQIWDGVAWVQVGTINASTHLFSPYNGVSGLTAGSVLFVGGGGTMTQNNAHLFWDNSALNLSIPSASLAGTTLATPAAGALLLGGIATAPALGGSGEGATYLSSAGGLLFQGQGSTDDLRFLNKTGATVANVPTGTTNLNVVGALNDNGTAPTGTAGSGYVRATSPTIMSPLLINSTTTGIQTALWFYDAGMLKWELGKQTDNSFFIYDVANTANALGVSITGTTVLGESSNLTLVRSGGAQIGAPTGGDKGAGTLNPAGAIYDNGTAPTGTAGSGYVHATSPTLVSPTLTDPIDQGFAVATGTLTATSNTVLATVPGLSIALTAGKTYSCRAALWGTANASGGIKMSLVATGSLAGTVSGFENLWNAGTVISNGAISSAFPAALNAVTGAYNNFTFEGSVVVTTGGTINLQAAQNASFATSTTVLQGSTFSCTRVN